MKCKHCLTEFIPNRRKSLVFCNFDCFRNSRKKPPRYCKECNCELDSIRKIKFCSKSCATTFNNKNKKTGTRISKLERYIQKYLVENVKEEVVFNSKKIIGSELDIYFPKLKLAFEINGVFHYRPIFGEEKFQRIIAMDKIKKDRCIENNIKLIIINTDTQLQFSKISSQCFINIILENLAVSAI